MVDESGRTDWTDEDDAPPLTREWFEKADIHHGSTPIRVNGVYTEEGKRLLAARQVAQRLGTDETTPGRGGVLTQAGKAFKDAAEVPKLTRKIATLRAAAQALIDKLAICSPVLDGYVIRVHGPNNPYAGPTYSAEVTALQQALEHAGS